MNNDIFDNNYAGVCLEYARDSTIQGENNDVSNSSYFGIIVGSSWNNTITGFDNISNNGYGIAFYDSTNNTLANNTVYSNIEYGIYLESSSDNVIYNNYFNNTNNAWDNGTNSWNITKTAGTNIIGGSWLGGNYWSDYIGKDTNGDGLGDTLLPYTSNGGIQNGGDWLPLVKDPYTNVDVGVTSNITLANSSDLAAYLPTRIRWHGHQRCCRPERRRNGRHTRQSCG